MPPRRIKGKVKNIKFEKALLNNNGKPIDFDYNRDMTYDVVREPKDTFSRKIGKIMWRILPVDTRSWKFFSQYKGYNKITYKGKLFI